jgi:hypothetical protein
VRARSVPAPRRAHSRRPARGAAALPPAAAAAAVRPPPPPPRRRPPAARPAARQTAAAMADSEAAPGGEVVEFGWADEAAAKPLSGRRLKAKKEAQKKKKPGTFGAWGAGASRSAAGHGLWARARARRGPDRAAAPRARPAPRVDGAEPMADQGDQAQGLPPADPHPAAHAAAHPAGAARARAPREAAAVSLPRQWWSPAPRPMPTQPPTPPPNPHPTPPHPQRASM